MTANATVPTINGDANTPFYDYGWPPFSNANVRFLSLIRGPGGNTPVLNGANSPVMVEWGANIVGMGNGSANGVAGSLFSTMHTLFLGNLDIGSTMIFVPTSQTIAPVAPRNTSFPNAQ